MESLFYFFFLCLLASYYFVHFVLIDRALRYIILSFFLFLISF